MCSGFLKRRSWVWSAILCLPATLRKNPHSSPTMIRSKKTHMSCVTGHRGIKLLHQCKLNEWRFTVTVHRNVSATSFKLAHTMAAERQLPDLTLPSFTWNKTFPTTQCAFMRFFFREPNKLTHKQSVSAFIRTNITSNLSVKWVAEKPQCFTPVESPWITEQVGFIFQVLNQQFMKVWHMFISLTSQRRHHRDESLKGEASLQFLTG